MRFFYMEVLVMCTTTWVKKTVIPRTSWYRGLYQASTVICLLYFQVNFPLQSDFYIKLLWLGNKLVHICFGLFWGCFNLFHQMMYIHWLVKTFVSINIIYYFFRYERALGTRMSIPALDGVLHTHRTLT